MLRYYLSVLDIRDPAGRRRRSTMQSYSSKLFFNCAPTTSKPATATKATATTATHTTTHTATIPLPLRPLPPRPRPPPPQPPRTVVLLPTTMTTTTTHTTTATATIIATTAQKCYFRRHCHCHYHRHVLSRSCVIADFGRRLRRYSTNFYYYHYRCHHCH